jgi:hypothetical protein
MTSIPEVEHDFFIKQYDGVITYNIADRGGLSNGAGRGLPCAKKGITPGRPNV